MLGWGSMRLEIVNHLPGRGHSSQASVGLYPAPLLQQREALADTRENKSLGALEGKNTRK